MNKASFPDCAHFAPIPAISLPDPLPQFDHRALRRNIDPLRQALLGIVGTSDRALNVIRMDEFERLAEILENVLCLMEVDGSLLAECGHLRIAARHVWESMRSLVAFLVDELGESNAA